MSQDDGKKRVKGTNEFRVPNENDVVFQNEIIGSDPDANVRQQLLKDAQGGGGSTGGG